MGTQTSTELSEWAGVRVRVSTGRAEPVLLQVIKCEGFLTCSNQRRRVWAESIPVKMRNGSELPKEVWCVCIVWAKVGLQL